MCGIVGFTGELPAKDILISGLEQLEYRGYDSAGIAILDDEKGLLLKKKTGHVADLREAAKDMETTGTCGIGHTRWATHGGVTEANAHPHNCGTVTLIHNGIIENYLELIMFSMIMIRSDGRGLHDMIAKTKVVSCDKYGNEKEKG